MKCQVLHFVCLILISFAVLSVAADRSLHLPHHNQLLNVHLSTVDGGGLVVNFTLTNPSNAAIKYLPFDTPLEGDLYGPIFRIYDAKGNSIPYVGKVARRAPPSPSDYLILNAGSSVYGLIDLAAHYEFLVPGYYIIYYPGYPHFEDYQFSRSHPIIGHLEGDVTIYTKRREARATNQLGSTNCNNNELNQVAAAVNGAKTESRAAYNCMNANTCRDLSVRWFGTFSQGNYDYDKRVFQSVNSRLNSAPFNAYCNPAGCGSNVYAYVYPSDPAYTVYLCGMFWSAPAERVNTVVHEMSHFSTLGGTQDYAYGKTACLNLARSNPTRASRNADNVCYFSEEAALLFGEQ